MYGAIAQLGERLNGIQEVTGSIPVSSTIRQSGDIHRRPSNPLPSEESGFFCAVQCPAIYGIIHDFLGVPLGVRHGTFLHGTPQTLEQPYMPKKTAPLTDIKIKATKPQTINIKKWLSMLPRWESKALLQQIQQ